MLRDFKYIRIEKESFDTLQVDDYLLFLLGDHKKQGEYTLVKVVEIDLKREYVRIEFLEDYIVDGKVWHPRGFWITTRKGLFKYRA